MNTHAGQGAVNGDGRYQMKSTICSDHLGIKTFCAEGLVVKALCN